MRSLRRKLNFRIQLFKWQMVKLFFYLYCKPTDSHQYLHYDSCHAEHVQRSIAFSQTLRLERIWYQKSNLDSHIKELKNWLSKKSYPEKIIRHHMKRNGYHQWLLTTLVLQIYITIFVCRPRNKEFLRQLSLSPCEVLGT